MSASPGPGSTGRKGRSAGDSAGPRRRRSARCGDRCRPRELETADRLTPAGHEHVALAGPGWHARPCGWPAATRSSTVDRHPGTSGIPARMAATRPICSPLTSGLARSHETSSTLWDRAGAPWPGLLDDETGEVIGPTVDQGALFASTDGVRPVATIQLRHFGTPRGRGGARSPHGRLADRDVLTDR